MPTRFASLIPFLVSMLVISCSESETRLKAKIEEPPPFEPLSVASLPKMSDPVLARGRETYIQDCDRCHRIGKAGAPRTGERAAWVPRITQGIDQLIKHAVEGYESPQGNEMPERGGNPDLSDNEVEAAVRFLVHLIQEQQ